VFGGFKNGMFFALHWVQLLTKGLSMPKKIIIMVLFFTITIGIGIPGATFAAEKSSLESATYVFKVGTNLMGVGMQWFVQSNYNWSSATNGYISKMIDPIVGMFFGLIVLLVEFIMNLIIFYATSFILMLIGLIITIFGAILVPIVLFFSTIGMLFSPD